MKKKQEFKLRLRGKSFVLVDWANVYGWKKSLKKAANPKKLYDYLRLYKEIKQIYFYFGTDNNRKSKSFLKQVAKIGYRVVTKPVKYILVNEINGQKTYRRKCDFDMEICIDVHQALKENYDGFIFFTGDGDFEPLYKLLVKLRKQVIVVYVKGHLGKEVWEMKQGIFKVEMPKLVGK